MQRHLDMRDTFFPTISERNNHHAPSMDSGGLSNDRVKLNSTHARTENYGAQSHEDDLLAAASWELVEKPTYHGTAAAAFSLPTLTLIATYFASFGTELAVASFLGAYYHHNFPGLGQTGADNWAAMFGLLNVVFRPIGGVVSDVIYRYTGSLWGKKIWTHILGFLSGMFLLLIGLLDPKSLPTMICLMTGLAFVMEAGNGACFSLVPHVHPTSNGT